MYIADLHIHSKYSRATSKELDPCHLDLWARYKGISLVGTGDFTHSQWRQELKDALIPAEEGFYRLKRDLALPGEIGGENLEPRFVLTGEISSIYKKNGKTRKVHNVIILPDFEAAENLSRRLEAIGNIHSDGRPILGLDCRDLLEITLEAAPQAVFIPAHIWTPHFSLFGAFSGFDTIEECFEDLTPHIHALETGLSSDPPMNWRISALDRFTLVSNSDAHSPAKLGREANLLATEFNYSAMAKAIETGQGFQGTLEFFPEEGKYHWDGHRSCQRRLKPEETIALNGLCPHCGKKITIGVEHRVEELADRPRGYKKEKAKDFESLVPLGEIIAAATGVSAAAKKTQSLYFQTLAALGSEFHILRQAPIEDIEKAAGIAVAKGIQRLRRGEVKLTPGYDGEYGSIALFTPEELEELRGEQRLFTVAAAPAKKKQAKTLEKKPKKDTEVKPAHTSQGLNPQQLAAVTAPEKTVAVIAGPGTGKTQTLIQRIAHLIEVKGVSPKEITAVTFTNRAAAEMEERLIQRLGGKNAIKGLTVGTFHRVSLDILPPQPLLAPEETRKIIGEIASIHQEKTPIKKIAQEISLIKNGVKEGEGHPFYSIFQDYEARLKEMGCRDLDSLLTQAKELPIQGMDSFKNLLVDEFQDINPIQQQLVNHWAKNGSLFVIGDPDQAIYGFRGANPQCFTELAQDFPDLVTIELRENYRSTPEILTAALEVINHNPGPQRNLQANLPQRTAVRKINAPTPFAEAVAIAKEISRLTGGVDMNTADILGHEDIKPRSFREIAVLCRTKKQLALIEDCLAKEGIPGIIHGRYDDLAEEDIQGCLNFFRSLLEPQNTQALAQALDYLWDFPQDLIKKAVKIYAKVKKPQVQPLADTLGSFGHLEPWYKAIDLFAPKITKEKPRHLLEDWGEFYGLTPALEKLIATAALYPTMDKLLKAVVLGRDSDVERGIGGYTSGAVRLMTLHAAKGLEFPLVFLSGLHRGSLPLVREEGNENIQEERRLFYVGITRAKEELIITAGGQASPFSQELPTTVKQTTIKLPPAPEPTLFPGFKA